MKKDRNIVTVDFKARNKTLKKEYDTEKIKILREKLRAEILRERTMIYEVMQRVVMLESMFRCPSWVDCET